MAESSRFWTTTGTGDGPAGGYTAAQFQQFVRQTLMTDTLAEGVLKGIGNELAVTGAAGSVSVATGSALVYGVFYENNSPVSVAVTNTSGATRIDRIVLRADFQTSGATQQTVRIAKLDGTPGGSAASLTQSPTGLFEIPLATVTITSGGTITVADARTFVKTPGTYGYLDDSNIINAAQISANAVTTAKILDANVTTAKIADNAVTTAKILDANVTTAKILDANVTTAKILDANVTTAKLAAGAVTSAKLATDAVQTVSIAAGAVTSTKLATDAVQTASIAANAVTTVKILDANVTGAKVAVRTITGNTAGNIALLTITADNISTSTITGGKIAANTITGNTAGNIAAETITADNIAANTITGAKVAVRTITGNTAGNIALLTITADNISTSTITGGKIAATTITGGATGNIAASTITADNIAATTITGAKIVSNTIGTLQIADDAITQQKLADNAVVNASIVDNAIQGQKLGAWTARFGGRQGGSNNGWSDPGTTKYYSPISATYGSRVVQCAGSISVSISGSATGSAVIEFADNENPSTPAFASNPIVIATVSGSQDYIVDVINAGVSDATIRLQHRSGSSATTSVTVFWIAIGTTAT